MLTKSRAINLCRRLLAPIAILTLAACGEREAPNQSEQAPSRLSAGGSSAGTNDACSTTALRAAQSYGEVSRLSGAFVGSPAEIARWMASRLGPSAPSVLKSQYSSYASDSELSVCYFDGRFMVAKGPPNEQPPLYTRIDIIVGPDGRAYLDAAGTQESLPTLGPDR